MATDLPRTSDAARLRAANLRTGIALGVIAVLFFVGVLVTEYIGGPLTAITVTGTAVLAFLAVGIGRHLRKPRQ
jgi:hypothetical protein